MPTLVPFRLACACALAMLIVLCAAPSASAKKVEAELRVVARGKVLAEDALRAGTTRIPTSHRADCFGAHTGGSGRTRRVPGATALGLLAEGVDADARLRPLLITDAFDFGLGICGVGGYEATSKLSWYLKVDHRNPELGGELVKLHPGDEVLWALAPYPYPSELSLVAPSQATPGVPFQVRVFAYDDKGRRRPAAGATVTGAEGPTDPQGRATVTLTAPAALIAKRGKDLPSNRVEVCVAAICG